MKVEMARGMRDYEAKDMIVRERLLQLIKKQFERYGFSPMQTPLIERLDTLTAKFAAGDGTDVMQEIFKLQDQGKRDLGLKFDQTVPLARYIAMHPQTKLPFKRYTIDRSYRDGPIKTGRFREFTQCDADIVGPKSMHADAEIISLTLDILKESGIQAEIQVNNRKILLGLLEHLLIPSKLFTKVIIVIDKIDKMEHEEFFKELSGIGLSETQIDALANWCKGKVDLDSCDIDNKIAKEGLAELRELMRFIPEELKADVRFTISLARGLNYYTGTVFEAFAKKGKMKSSLAGGGRYDDMIGSYVGGREYPAIGVGIGLDAIIAALGEQAEQHSVAQLLIIPIGTEPVEMVRRLRTHINTIDDLNRKGVTKNLQYANHYHIPFVAFIGEEELQQNKIKLRDMKSGEEQLLSVEEVIAKIGDV
ncbi:histidine--tRNA ligase [Candidatus Woesearchaeota archaeon]|nr:histidine--tRNA ligase [Candidatus Woesearchaeota archaeon]